MYSTQEERIRARKTSMRKYDQKRAVLHKDRIDERNRKYREQNRKKLAVRSKKWREDNPEIYKSICRRMNFRRRGAAVPKSVKLDLIMKNKDCAICKLDLNGDVQIDHILPVSKGGTSEFGNLQAVHSLCNQRKGANILLSVCPA